MVEECEVESHSWDEPGLKSTNEKSKGSQASKAR